MAGSDEVSTGFPPLVSGYVRLLILGSLPGRRSLDAGEYYAHPRNAFWPLAEDLFGVPQAADYHRRMAGLAERGIALWDVLHSSRRAGSLDADIDMQSAKCNDFQGFLADHRSLRLIAFNGRKAGELFTRRVLPGLSLPVPKTLVLPSTSPAHAAMSYADKRRRWQAVTKVLR